MSAFDWKPARRSTLAVVIGLSLIGGAAAVEVIDREVAKALLEGTTGEREALEAAAGAVVPAAEALVAVAEVIETSVPFLGAALALHLLFAVAMLIELITIRQTVKRLANQGAVENPGGDSGGT